MNLLKHKSNKEMAYDMLTLLKEMEVMTYHNIGCYANKEEYKKEYATELYKLELITQLKLDLSKQYKTDFNINMLLYDDKINLTNQEIEIVLK